MFETMSELLVEDVHYAVRFLPRDLRQIIIEHKLMIAGGFLRSVVSGEKVTDIDVFGPSVEALDRAAMELAVKYGTKPTKTRNAITVVVVGRAPVQFITRWLYTEAEAVIHSFDFTVAQAILYPAKGASLIVGDLSSDEHPPISIDAEAKLIWRGICSPRFYADLSAKRLVYTQPQRNEDAGGSMLRVVKFLRRGYSISPASLGKVMARMAERVRWDHHICADEEGKAKVLTGLLRQVDPLLAIDGTELAEDEEVSVADIKDALHPTMFADAHSIPDTGEKP